MTTPVVVIGASGFGRECLDVIEAMRADGSSLELLGVLDDSPSEANLTRLSDRGVAYLGTIDSWLATSDQRAQFVLGIGNPRVRQALVTKFEVAQRRPATLIHPTASLGSRFQAGDGLVICAGAVISTNVRTGNHVHINPNVTIGHDAVLADHVSVNPGAVISGEVTVGNRTLVGAGAVVLQNIEICEDVVIGAGAVVTKNVPPSRTMVGVPARSAGN